MSFATLTFAFFLLIVFAVYWLVLGRNYKWQNIWLLGAGYVFYGWWDWRFISLIFLITVLSWSCALAKSHRKIFTSIGIVVNLMILCVFKYYNFFGDGLQRLANAFGGAIDWVTIDILLPVGISFYTFQAISYSVDVYKRKIKPAHSFINYAVYIAFFPQLVAGPIEKAGDLLPQFDKPRKWNYEEAVLGMRQILWGLFKKCVVADGVSFWVTNGYYHIHDDSLYGHFQCFIAVIGFALQIYGDFSGYSDIARGTARLFGIKLMNNFLYPFFSRNAIELWHRWHRSLMQWLTEYVYIPLGGSRNGRRLVNVMIVFLLSGLWHGASSTFILWGGACGVWYIISFLCGVKRYRPESEEAASVYDLPKIALTFVLFCIVFISFRAADIEEAFTMYYNLINPGLLLFALIIFVAWLIRIFRMKYWMLIALIVGLLLIYGCIHPGILLRYMLGMAGFVFGAVLIAVEWKSRMRSFALERMPRQRWLRTSIYMVLYVIIFCFAVDSGDNHFIYFQF